MAYKKFVTEKTPYTIAPGKTFEKDFKNSVPNYMYVQRINDLPLAYLRSESIKFAPKRPYDFFVFDAFRGLLYCIELKSTKYKSMSFDDIDGEESDNRMIKKHQLVTLKKLSKYNNLISCMILNFRDDERDVQRTYYITIERFLDMANEIGKQSFNEVDLIMHGATVIPGEQLRTHWTWDLESLFAGTL